MKSTSNTIVLIIMTIVIAGGAYWYFSSGKGNEPPLAVSGGENVAQAQFKALVSKLQHISFRTDIFSNPNFMALVDLSTPVVPEAVGRIDPFAPISEPIALAPAGE